MANEFYISAGLIPNDSGETNAANTFYISAGLVPDDLETGGLTESIAGTIIFSADLTRKVSYNRALTGAI